MDVESPQHSGHREVRISPPLYFRHFVCKVVESFAFFLSRQPFSLRPGFHLLLLLLLLCRRRKHHRQSLRPPSCQSGYAASLEQRQFISCHHGGMRSAAKTGELLLGFMCIYIFLDNGHVWDLIQKTPPLRGKKKLYNREQLERVAAAGC